MHPNRFRPLALALALSAFALPVGALALRQDPAPAEESESARKERKAHQLMVAMNQREVAEKTTAAAAEAFTKMGLPEDFKTEFLDRFDYDHVIDLTVDVYAEELDEETLDALIAFYGSEQGKVFVEALPDISVAALRAGQKYGEELATEIMQGK